MSMLDLFLGAYPEDEILKADGFDEAIIGYHHKLNKLIYSVNGCIDILINEGMTQEDALEYFYFNVEGAYVGPQTPIWLNEAEVAFYEFEDDKDLEYEN